MLVTELSFDQQYYVAHNKCYDQVGVHLAGWLGAFGNQACGSQLATRTKTLHWFCNGGLVKTCQQDDFLVGFGSQGGNPDGKVG